MPTRSTRHLLALAVALIGVLVSAIMLWVELQIEQDSAYVSFCNLGAQMNCDAVLASRWARVLELPLPAWAIAVFLTGGAAALPGAVLGTVGGAADVLLLGLAAGSLGFALVLLYVASVLIGTLCPLCLALDAVIVAWCVIVLPLARTLRLPQAVGWGTVAAAVAVSAGGGTLWALATPPPVTTVDEVEAQAPDFAAYYRRLPVLAQAGPLAEGGKAKGPEDAAVTIVEFSDFQCPACQRAFDDLRDLVGRRQDVRVVFRHFPLDERCNERVQHSLHPQACMAACAAECADQQGAFWEYHDRLFDDGGLLDRDTLFRHARDLKLDIPAFRTCLDAPETMDRVREDVRRGIALDVASTPTLFVNGRRLDGALERSLYDYAVIIEKHAAGAGG